MYRKNKKKINPALNNLDLTLPHMNMNPISYFAATNSHWYLLNEQVISIFPFPLISVSFNPGPKWYVCNCSPGGRGRPQANTPTGSQTWPFPTLPPLKWISHPKCGAWVEPGGGMSTSVMQARRYRTPLPLMPSKFVFTWTTPAALLFSWRLVIAVTLEICVLIQSRCKLGMSWISLMQVLESSTASWLASDAVWAFRFTAISSTVFKVNARPASTLYLSQQLALFSKVW